MREKCIPNGFTQKQSGCTGSRTVMWPATPSSKPYLAKMRNAHARVFFRWARSWTLSVKVGGRRKGRGLASGWRAEVGLVGGEAGTGAGEAILVRYNYVFFWLIWVEKQEENCGVASC